MSDKVDVDTTSCSSLYSSSESENENENEIGSDVRSIRRPGCNYYPAYCFKISPTWFAWVKLTAYDVHHRLHSRNGFQSAGNTAHPAIGWQQESTPLLFYLNHPIQFVQLVGVLVTFEEYYERFWLFVIDDSSGATIEVQCAKPIKDTDVTEGSTNQTRPKDPDAESRWDAMQKLDVGVCVQVKGRISTFRNVRQLQLERIVILHDTNDEMRLVRARLDFYHTVLATAWEVSAEEQRALQKEAHSEAGEHDASLCRRQRLQQRLIGREKRHARQILKQYKREEESRRERAEQARRAGMMLAIKR